MAEIDDIPKTYDDAVLALAQAHGEGGAADLEIYAFPDPAAQVVRFVEVSDTFQETGEVRPLAIGRSAHFPFRSSAALATHDEWDKVRAGQIPLPPGWDLGQVRRVWP